MCTAFTILDYSVDVITQFDLPPRIAAERILCHFFSDNFEQYTCSIHESIERRFGTCAIVNVFFNNKRKLQTDSSVADGVKSISNKAERKVNLRFLLP